MKVSRVDILIKKVRALTSDEDFSTEDEGYGVNDEPFIIALSDAQMELQAAIVERDCSVFTSYEEIQAVANQESYNVPTRAFVENLIYEIMYSPTGLDKDFYPLDDRSIRAESESGDPDEYVIEGNQFFVNPVPPTATGVFRVRFEQSLDQLDKRRGTVASYTGTLLAPLTITIEEDPDDEMVNDAEYINVVSRHGTIKARNIPIESYDSSTLTFTIETDWEPEDDITGIDEGDFITVGLDATTHPNLHRICESYLVNAAAYDIQRLKSSTDSEEQNGKLTRLLNRILAVYEKLPSGKQSIPERRW